MIDRKHRGKNLIVCQNFSARLQIILISCSRLLRTREINRELRPEQPEDGKWSVRPPPQPRYQVSPVPQPGEQGREEPLARSPV